MNDTTLSYPPSPASLFAAREVKIVWTWCKFCGTCTDQMLDHDDTGGEVYRCLACGNENRERVKP